MKMLLLALALPALLAAAPAPKPSPAPTLERLVAICKLPPADAQRAIAALPDQAQAAAMLLCIGYQRGQLDLLDLLQGTPGKAVSIAFTKCGPDGTVDWDDNPVFPPPHCNRNGWDGRRYRSN